MEYKWTNQTDTFYAESGKSGRVQIGIELNDGQMAQVDLEDVLRFARTHCTGIYERVMCEAKPLR